jgi:pimeloyl-ACP methyl ester carboxylesterase
VLTPIYSEWPPGFPPELADSIERESMMMQEEMAALSSHSTHILVEDSGHMVHNDQPEVVIDAILDLLAQIRQE